jgi:hypothetical protein
MNDQEHKPPPFAIRRGVRLNRAGVRAFAPVGLASRLAQSARLVWSLLFAAAAVLGADLTILVVDSQGQAVHGCRVESFRTAAPSPSAPQVDYGSRFRGLIGDGVPPGQYTANIACGGLRIDEDMVTYGPGDFQLLSLTDRTLRSEPVRPTLSIKFSDAPPTGETWWVRLAGLYRSEIYTAGFGAGGEAVLVDPEPGVYLVSVHSAGGYACFSEVEFMEFTKHWVFHPGSCSFEFDRHAHLVDRDPSHKLKASRWAEEMRREREDLYKALDRGADAKH